MISWKDDILILTNSGFRIVPYMHKLKSISPYVHESYLDYTWFHSTHHDMCTHCVQYKSHGSS